MFFSTELLSKRDSGYGLLWLAATLGSKSKKLPRRSVLTADIIQLCGLVSDPLEPLALRLSSNLMVGVVRVYKLKHEIFETDVSNCVTSLKKTLQELHSMNITSLEMAQPNGLREDALNLAVEPGMAMANEFDGIMDMDWDFSFRSVGEEKFLEDDDADRITKSADPAGLRLLPIKKKLHQLDESHDHLFSSSFMNSLSEELGGENEGPSSSAHDVLFDLDFGGDPDVGLGEEMVRDLEEAWNMKANTGSDVAPAPGPAGTFDFSDVPMDIDQGFRSDQGEAGMDFGDVRFGPEIEHGQVVDGGSAMPGDGQDNGIPDANWLRSSPANVFFHSPPPHNQAPARSILSRRSVDVTQDGHAPQGEDQSQFEQQEGKTGSKGGGGKKPRKKVTLVDPRLELTDEELKFQRDNYPQIMEKLRREAQKKKEQKEGKRRFEEELWAPPKEWRAPELIEWYNQRVVYPVKAREAAWRKELEELQHVHHPKKKRRILEKAPSEQLEEEYVPKIQELGAPGAGDFNFGMDVDMETVGGFGGDWGGIEDTFNGFLPAQGELPSGGHRSSDDPGQPRRASSRPPSLPGSSLLGRGAFNLSQGDRISNSIFPWDNAGPSSSSNPAMPVSVGLSGGSELGLGLSLVSMAVRVRKGSRLGSTRESPVVHPASLQGEEGEADIGNAEGLEFDVSVEEQNPGESQGSESMVTLERNSFNFLGYAKMHTASESRPLFFSDIVPIESSSTRVAAEGFYHCLALATKDLIRLQQSEPHGPIRIQIK